MRSPSLQIAVLAAAAIGAAVLGPGAGAAAASTICVGFTESAHRSTCDALTPSLQSGLSTAELTTATADTVLVAAGDFPTSTGFTYNGSGANTVQIVGAGAGQTRLSRSSAGPVLSVQSAQRSEVSELSATASGGSMATRSTGVTVTWAFDDGATAAGALVTRAFATAGTHTATVTATDPAGLTATAPVTVTVTTPRGGGGGGGNGGVNPASPAITKLSLSPSAFLTSGRKPGTVVGFTLTKPGTTRFTVEQATKGRKVKGSCVKASSKNRKAKSCTRYVTLQGAIDRKGAAGSNTFRFTGVLDKKTLAPGSYRLAATIGKTVKRPSFTVKRAPREKKK